MNHLRARRLLARLPDGGLAPALEARVRSHAARCPRCQRILSQHEAVERLLRRMPRQLLPEEASCSADAALGLLARWAVPPSRWWERIPVHSLGAVGTAIALLVSMFVLTPPFETTTAEPFNAVVIAAVHARDEAHRPERRHRSHPAQPPSRHANETYLIPVAVR